MEIQVGMLVCFWGLKKMQPSCPGSRDLNLTGKGLRNVDSIGYAFCLATQHGSATATPAWTSIIYTLQKSVLPFLAASVYGTGVFIYWTVWYCSHNPSLILPPVCPASSPTCFKLVVLDLIDDGLENIKIVEYMEAITQLLVTVRWMQYYGRDFNYPNTLTSEVHYRKLGSTVIQIPLLSGQFWANESSIFRWFTVFNLCSTC
jgi:hypothetical protein